MSDAGVATEHRSDRDRSRRPARGASSTLGGGLRSYEAGGRDAARRLPARRAAGLRAWPGAHPVAEPDRGRELRVRRQADAAPAHRAGARRTRSTASSAGATWSVVDREPDRVVMEYALEPAARLSVHARAQHRVRPLGRRPHRDDDRTNLGSGRCPYGCGQHPYLTLGTPTVDTLRAAGSGAGRRRSPTSAAFPCGSAPVDGTEYDFRAGADDRRRPCSTTPSPSSSATATAAPVSCSTTRTGGAGLTLWVDESYPYLMLFTGDSRPTCAGAASPSSR